MVLAIEADGASYRQSGSVRDRDRLRGEHLQRLGWRYHRLWSTNWFQNPDAEVAKVRAAYQRAVSGTGPDAQLGRAGTSAEGDARGGSSGDLAGSGASRGFASHSGAAGDGSAVGRARGEASASDRPGGPGADQVRAGELAPAQSSLGQSGPVPLPAAGPERPAIDPRAGQRAREPVRLTLPARRDPR
jgi:hypothetical protein